MRALRPGLDAVHDVTIAYHNYKDGGPPSDKTMLAGILLSSKLFPFPRRDRDLGHHCED